VIRFSRASLRISHSGICDPVMITGLRRPASRNGTADAVYAIVSVPCSTTKPS
jgi:hypothetical protein